MQQGTQFDYAALALKRWPRAAAIYGSGKYAVRFLQDGRNHVRLFETGAEAIAFSHPNHGDFFDLDYYARHQQPVKFVKKPHWFREINV